MRRAPAGRAVVETRSPRNEMNVITRYAHWLHTGWPSGTVEKLPEVNSIDGATRIPGVYLVGDLNGIPLLKFAADSGARAARAVAARVTAAGNGGDMLDLVIVGAGVSGMSAALEARRLGLRFVILESSEPFSTLVNFPKGKPIYTYPTGMTPSGDLQLRADVKEALVDEAIAQTRGVEVQRGRAERIVRRGGALEVLLPGQPALRARNVIVAIGRSGNYRKLGVPGDGLSKVFNRLHDPAEFAGRDVLVVGGGDSALETALAIAQAGGRVTLSYRKPEFSRAKPENINRLAGDHRISVMLGSRVREIREQDAMLFGADGAEVTLANDVVFSMIGREPPLDFFRRSGIPIRGERTLGWWLSLVSFLAFCVWMYHWKKGGVTITGFGPVDRVLDVGTWWRELGWFPFAMAERLSSLGGLWTDPTRLAGTLRISAGEPGFWYSLAYCACVGGFGIDRIVRRPTPYVRVQTVTLAAIQLIPLFVLPYVVLPWLGHNGAFDAGAGKWFADTFFPAATYTEHHREYWRAFGFVLAWPLFIWNVFTQEPMWGWLIVSLIQTFVIIPIIVFFWGKGAYCGWICSCGALSETLGDRHREKMPHGPGWNRLNMLGQAILLFAMSLLALRLLSWAGVGWAGRAYESGLSKVPLVNYVWFVDLLWAGIFGVGLYFWFSGRVWCRFACPLAALMHIYARFSRFRILADKKKCISCNVCTSVCHQGIDVMSFANKGQPMADPQCVRCSACVQSCPTGVLSFGQVQRDGRTIRTDAAWLAASPVVMREIRVNGRKVQI